MPGAPLHVYSAPPLFTLEKSRTSHRPFLGCVYDRNDYRIGISSVALARHLQYNVDVLRPNVRLRVSDPDAGVDLTRELANKFPGGTLPTVIMNTTAVCTIGKRSPKQRSYQKPLADALQYHVSLKMLDPTEFLRLPFSYPPECGIILPRDVQREDVQRIDFAATVIFPAHYADASRERTRKRDIAQIFRAFSKS